LAEDRRRAAAILEDCLDAGRQWHGMLAAAAAHEAALEVAGDAAGDAVAESGPGLPVDSAAVYRLANDIDDLDGAVRGLHPVIRIVLGKAV
jgi:hypothetical protein